MLRTKLGVQLLIASLLLTSGCYRSVSLRPAQLSQFHVEGHSAQAVYPDGHTLTVDDFDEVAVDARWTPPKAAPSTTVSTERRAIFSFRAPVAGGLDAGTLDLRDDRGRATFPSGTVSTIELSKHAPERALIVLGVAVGSAVLLGTIAGAASACDPESDGDFCGYEALRNAAVVGTLGLGVGLAIGIPLTSGLGIESGTQRTAAPRRW